MISATVLAPDLILHNGLVHTLDADCPAASAVAVKDGRILAVGQDAGDHTVGRLRHRDDRLCAAGR